MVIAIQDNSTLHFDVFEQGDGQPIPRIGEEISLGYVPAPKVTRVMWLYYQYASKLNTLSDTIRKHLEKK